jgi:hypothetical protein
MKKNVIFWLRLSYWFGALLDVATGFIMIFPGLFDFMNKPAVFQFGHEHLYAMGMGAPLMLGWSLLLQWADRKPQERKGILQVTLVVAAREAVTQIWVIAAGFVRLPPLIPTFGMQIVLSTLFLFSYFNATTV